MSVVVITLAKNDLEGLRRTSRSVLMQSLKVTWQIVTPNDGSPTHQLANEMIQKGLASKVIEDEGLGIYHAMNLGISWLEEDDWVWFLNSGDEFGTQDSYRLVADAIYLCRNRWVYGGHLLGSSNGKILGEIPPPKIFEPKNQLFARHHISHQSTIFEAKFIRELGGFNESYKLAADWDLMVRASKVDLGFSIPAPISTFYMGVISTKSRAVGNRELLQLRHSHLPTKFIIKSYIWFYYRTWRNAIVQLSESTLPNQANIIRKARIRLKKRLNDTSR